MNIHCPHFGKCSGCKINEHVSLFPIYEDACHFFQKLGINHFTLNTLNPIHWRTRAKLAVRGSKDRPLVGLFKEGSHDVVDIPDCRVHHPSINKGATIIKEWIEKFQIEPFDDHLKAGLLKYLQMTVETSTGRLQLVLILNCREDAFDGLAQINHALKELWESHPGVWHSIWVNFNIGKDNTIFSPRWLLIAGDYWLKENICGVNLSLHPGSFVQANLKMFEKLVNRLKEFVPNLSSVLEYYAGSGVIGLSLAEKCRQLTFVEVVPLAKMSFDETIKTLSKESVLKLNYICKTSQSRPDLLKTGVDVVIVDPPRKGLDDELIKAFCESAKTYRLIYISCGFQSFKNDCKMLLDAGFCLTHAESYLFFPGSEHIEVLAIFDKA